MLTRIYIDNFRSFVNFDYKPMQKQLLLGANGSGKSSLLDAIRYLKAFIEDDQNFFTQTTRTRWQDKPMQVIELQAQLDHKVFTYRVEIEFAKDTKQQTVHRESLTVNSDPVFELKEGEIHFFLDNGMQAPPVPFEVTHSCLRMAQLSNSQVRRFVEWLKSVHCFKIDPYPEKMDERAESEERRPDYELENLAPWYRYLIQHFPDENARFLNSLRACLKGFQRLRFSAEEDGVRRLWADFDGLASRGSNRFSCSLSELSDGQRNLIGLYMILHFAIRKGDTVFIDEPDNYIALPEIQPWLMAASEAVEDSGGRLILISHHPEFLNQWASDYGLRFFREENGHVRTEPFRPDPENAVLPSELIARGWSVD